MRPVLMLPLFAAAVFAQTIPASQKCSQCHAHETHSQAATGMAHALSSAEACEILRTHSKLTYQQGPWSWSIERRGGVSMYRVTNGHDEFSAPIQWAFGLGAAGQTYLLNRNSIWYESRVSFYRDTGALDLTVGAQPGVPRTLDEAVGREMSAKGSEECFNCHSTGAVSDGVLRVDALVPGIQCERCHAGASAHVAQSVIPRKLGAMSTEEMADYCGQCHRTWATIATQGPKNITNVRFQPYRLVNSKCYDAADARIRCVACHDPHDDGPRPVASYDARCKACHSPGGKRDGGRPDAKLCSVAKSSCVECHMPKVRLPDAHNAFTDHWIRIARPGAPYPS